MNETYTILALVRAGLGLALVPESTRSLGVRDVVLRDIPLDDVARAELVLSWRKNDANPVRKRFCDMALALFGLPPDPG